MVNEGDELRRFEDMMSRMFESLWGRPRRRPLLPAGEREAVIPVKSRQPFIDVIENDKEVIATAEMPGLEKKEIKINLTENRLEISAETEREEKKEEKGYVYRERGSARYYRAISLPSPVDPDNARASYKNGVLEITMPKTEVKKKKPVEIE